MRLVLFLLLFTFATNSFSARTNLTIPFAARPGLTGDPCKSGDDCQGGRKCAPRNTVSLETCDDRVDCQCKFDDPQSCQKSEDCDEGELCATSIKNSDGNACRSTAAVQQDDAFAPVDEPGSPQASPAATDGVCIDVDALAHLPAHALIFQEHPFARVLCDMHGSCATPGHIITYDSKPMMMLSFCQIVSCTTKIIRVNSPRYSRALRVPSRTPRLQYTALAARYESTAEEAVLGAVLRLGL